MSEEEKIVIELEAESNIKRLDLFLVEQLQKKKNIFVQGLPSRSQISNWIDSGAILVNGKKVSKRGLSFAAGSTVILKVPLPRILSVEPEKGIPFEIIYEDRYLLVVNKPVGLVVHPGAGTKKGTLVNALLDYLGSDLKQIGDALRPGIVHRLDKDTSGLMVVAKTQDSFQHLTQQLKAPRTMKRVYLALCYQLPKKKLGSTVNKSGDSGKIDLSLGRHPTQRTKMAVLKKGGKEAVTHWQVEKIFKKAVLLKVTLETGRTHQIRVHLNATGADIIGDKVYAKVSPALSKDFALAVKKFGRQALHATELSFIHPVYKKEVSFRTELPEDMRELIKIFKIA